ncbi:DUF998 domain-containing protein [Natronosporangium hydrolyticum]|uniref:DUF998 domain-containing protein n=1 Tax=Natronosporangium hydrolyticum TaxID=2811111 RepID=A0A895YBX1_9ACTN|nr:DUF998 domain-containing protein [Natronosporangium hydrolyticum]QSB12819.1 DUF998 domain-containing protein [Natronosporangium hydrolyticum]
MTTITVPTTDVAAPPVSASTRRLLLAGAWAGPFFFASAGIQMATREGFDITRHPISQLATGGPGWVQIATFIVAGMGILALAAGVARTLTTGTGRRALPILLTIFGLGLIASGAFPMDPEHGFPVGTPDGPVAQMSWHSMVHSAAAVVAFTAAAIAAIVLAVRHLRRRSLLPAIFNAVVALVLLLPTAPAHMSIQIALTGVVAFGWASALAVSLRRAA